MRRLTARRRRIWPEPSTSGCWRLTPTPTGRIGQWVADRAVGRLDNGLAALVGNAVPPYRTGDVAAVVVPACRVMLAPTVAQVAGHLEVVWTLEPVNADAPVERFLIGDNIMDNGPTYYGCYRNQAVITRTQPLDIQFASMLPQTRYLMLTDLGGPIEFVKAEAHERDIPLRQISTSTI